MDGPRDPTILLATCEVRPSASEEPQVARKGNNPVCNCSRHPSSRGSSQVNGSESGCNEVKHGAEFGVAPRLRTLMRSKTNHPSLSIRWKPDPGLARKREYKATPFVGGKFDRALKCCKHRLVPIAVIVASISG